jgi:hypothetical protein
MTPSSTLRLALLLLLLVPLALRGHPVPEETYDRTIVVHLTPRGIVVDYVLEVDATFAAADAVSRMTPKEIREVTAPKAVFERFCRDRAPEIAGNMLARLDGKTLPFAATQQRWQLLDHLRCEYRFETTWQLLGGKQHEVSFREANFYEEKGAVRLSLQVGEALRLLKSIQPDDALKNRPALELRPGDRDRLRNVSATVATSSPRRTEPRGSHERQGADRPSRPHPAP